MGFQLNCVRTCLAYDEALKYQPISNYSLIIDRRGDQSQIALADKNKPECLQSVHVYILLCIIANKKRHIQGQYRRHTGAQCHDTCKLRHTINAAY